MRAAGVATTRVRAAGVATTRVRAAGVATTRVRAAGVATTRVRAAGVATTRVRAAGVGAAAVRAAAVGAAGVATTRLRAAGVGAAAVGATVGLAARAHPTIARLAAGLVAPRSAGSASLPVVRRVVRATAGKRTKEDQEGRAPQRWGARFPSSVERRATLHHASARGGWPRAPSDDMSGPSSGTVVRRLGRRAVSATTANEPGLLVGPTASSPPFDSAEAQKGMTAPSL